MTEVPFLDELTKSKSTESFLFMMWLTWFCVLKKAVVALTWAVVSALSMTRTMAWRKNADGVRVRTAVCCWDTGAWSWPAAGQVWCKNSWASS